MTTRKREWEAKHHEVWVNKDLYQELEALKIRDESTNSVIGFLLEFYKAHRDDFGITPGSSV
jgi:hypothetical protein